MFDPPAPQINRTPAQNDKNGTPVKTKPGNATTPVKKTPVQKRSDFDKAIRTQNPSVSQKIKQWQSLGGGLTPPAPDPGGGSGKAREKEKEKEQEKDEQKEKEAEGKMKEKEEESEKKKRPSEKDEKQNRSDDKPKAIKEVEGKPTTEGIAEEKPTLAKTVSTTVNKPEHPKIEEPGEIKPTPLKVAPKILPKSDKQPVIAVKKTAAVKKTGHRELDADVLEAIAPKKRVVSDEHWRSNRQGPNEAGQPQLKHTNAWVRPARRPSRIRAKIQINIEPKPGPKIVRQSDAIIGFGAGALGNRERRKSVHTEYESEYEDDFSDEEEEEEEDEEEDKHDADDVDASTLLSSPPRKRIIVPKRVPGELERPQTVESNSRTRPPPWRRLSISTDSKPKYYSDVERYTNRQSHDESPRRPSSSRRRRPSSHRLEGMVDTPWQNYPREMLSADRRITRRRSQTLEIVDPPRTEDSPPKAPGNRIEAWLTAMPDPFVTSKKGNPEATKVPPLNESKAAPTDIDDSSVASTLTEKTRNPETKVETPKRRSTSYKRLSGEPSKPQSQFAVAEKSDLSVVTDKTDESPTLSLRRKGARRAQRSPIKEHFKSPPRDEDTEDKPGSSVISSSIVSSSVLSSSVASSSVDSSLVDPPQPLAGPLRRHFPSTGKKLSTIVSMASNEESVAPSESTVLDRDSDANTETRRTSSISNGKRAMPRRKSRTASVKKKLASNADLISVLSMQGVGRSKSIVSARSIRTNRSRLATATVGDLMNEFTADEIKYMRELRTLVDGVIPVLLTCVLSKSDSAVAAGLFNRKNSSSNDPNITKPIVDMGIALERLKSLHKRAPKEDADALLSWGQSAQRAYSEYVKSWRLGFQDVVVNLAPSADEDASQTGKTVASSSEAAWDEGLPRNEEGYVVNGDGERVDVAFLLKRPLVRLKYISKTYKGISIIKPTEQSEKIALVFDNLVTDARRKSNEERARLEDEAAAAIDPTRARDPCSLAPVSGVTIIETRCVKARDYFDMHLAHSSGQTIDCRVELLYRDDAPGKGTSGGDVLLCEVDKTGRWLLFPPIQASRISARNGDVKGEMVVMIRGYHSGGIEWSELLSLKTNEEEAAFEWTQMIGLDPVPPPITRSRSFAVRAERPTSSHGSSVVSAATESTIPFKSRSPSPREVEVPMGEQASLVSKRWNVETPDRKRGRRDASKVSPITSCSGDETSLQGHIQDSPASPPSPAEPTGSRRDRQYTTPTRSGSQIHDEDNVQTPKSLNDAMAMAGKGSPVPLKRTKATRTSRASPRSSRGSRSSRDFDTERLSPDAEELKDRKHDTESVVTSTASSLSGTSKGFSVWFPPSEPEGSSDEDEPWELSSTIATLQPTNRKHRQTRSVSERPSSPPSPHRRTSSVPSLDLPTIPKVRKSSQSSTPARRRSSAESSRASSPAPSPVPSSAPSKLQNAVTKTRKPQPTKDEANDTPPAPPPHRSTPSAAVKLDAASTPQFSPTPIRGQRRTSSPLKHEYQPSTASESSEETEESETESEFTSDEESQVEEENLSELSDLSEDELEHENIPTTLPPISLPPISEETKFPKVSPPESIYSLPNATISPSQSASNSPYRRVPQGSGKASRAIALIFSWSDKGAWENLHPDECSIVITPGLVEAFEISAAHSKPIMADGDDVRKPNSEYPLVALELTPLVPLRRGTALDISVRSPPTGESRLKASNNIMFRSRTPEECEMLYNLLNYSRINNPTYIALQNARGPYGQSSWAAAMDRRNENRLSTGSTNSWWNFGGSIGRSKSYRASSVRAPSAVASESSVGTMASAFSALKRFTGGNRLFNAAKSTLNSQSTGSYFSGSGSGGSGTSTPNIDPASGHAIGTPVGITNTKIRLYERVGQNKWRDMGAARLSIMNPDPNTTSNERQGAGSPGIRQPLQEKRIVILGKTKGECLLDVTLGESCFERIARTGIAVSVWEDVRGPNGEVGTVGAIGGVSAAKARIYMIQMKTERECAYSFSLLGKLRY